MSEGTKSVKSPSARAGARKPRSRRGAPGKAPPPKRQAPRTVRLRAVLWALASMGATMAVALAIVLFVYGRSRSEKPAPTAIEVDWPPGLTSEQAAAKLAALGLVESPSTMAVFLRASGGTHDFVAGPHLLPMGASPWELRRLLSRSIMRPGKKLVVPEGFNRFDIGARLEKLHIAGKRGFLAASADARLLAELGLAQPGEPPASAEGYLFPATYEFAADTDPRDVVRKMIETAEKRWQNIAAQHGSGLAHLRSTLGWGRREVVIMASIVEKEAGVDDERPMIASVFLNRLTDPSFHPKKLQSDPTSAYGCVAFADEAPSCKAFAGKPTPAINNDPANRYSTYTRTGLPPGPIGNPGARSLEAVLAPAASRYFYFVASGGGRHTFSESLEAHNEAVHRRRP
jgi:UPF0755 protein